MDEFDSWNLSKKKLESQDVSLRSYPKEGDVWMLTLGKNIGFEQNGVTDTFIRPCLVVKRFNNQMYWVVPLSRQQKDLNFYYNLTDPDGLPVSAILAQLRVVSVKRFNRRLYSMPTNIYFAIKNKLKSFL